ncbi:hypothetical protein NP233_g3546 [Leucocoprinus birnbaumii]|uniref:Uncharacterized protein n=1 Tax=Leucocoprinus birnbaumii TaxID=56174 RepID=A0AAD5VWB4_9AGAR|nr:hypothetical protein NP233_g3546 [Leucocoprinus birnbaumii]
MHPRSLTLLLLSSFAAVQAGNVTKGGQCNQGNSRLQTGTYQFWSDCSATTYCSDAGICEPKGCRKDDFPFGYAQDSHIIPDKCPRGQFCPDEGTSCQPLLAVGSPCQMNRDDQCEAPPNFRELADTTGRGLNVNGSVCLNNVCMWANVTLQNPCVTDNVAYIAYEVGGEFIDIVSRGNCAPGLYCDSQQKVCLNEKALGESCDGDKECQSWNCQADVALGIFGGMFGTLIGLFCFHRKQRDSEREKRLQYWKEQHAFHQNLKNMRETARLSILSLNERSARSTMYSQEAQPHRTSAQKASGLRNYMARDDGSDYDEVWNAAPNPPLRLGSFPPPTTMSSISSMDTVRPPPSPSPASSPTLEDDIAHGKAWLAHDDDNPDVDRKGKARENYVDLSEDNAELSDANSYPPMRDQDAETRRVEETLRQWEITERQRRKAARESNSSGTIATSPSLFTDVTRRASLLWRSSSRKRPSIGGKHTALSSTDNLDAVPLEDIAASPTPSPSPSPIPSPAIPLSVRERGSSATEDANSDNHHNAAENPFENPTTPTVLEAVSPFADSHRIDGDELRTPTDKLKTRAMEKRQSRPPPPPMPLDLPRPKTPPPAPISTPPYATDPPDATQRPKDHDDSGKETQWWHEWLCGCGEGPDRGGDYQAGRTNPFE